LPFISAVLIDDVRGLEVFQSADRRTAGVQDTLRSREQPRRRKFF
jgi:hypothetical protein